MKIAFATKDGKRINHHFGHAQSFAIYEITPEGYRFLEERPVSAQLGKSGESEEEDKILARVNTIKDCAMVYVAQIGGTAAAKVIKNNIHPMQAKNEEDIQETLERLKEVLKSPPPWLRKVLLKDQTTVSY